MRVLGIVCSPRKGGNTEILVGEALAAAREAGVETELFLVADKNIAPCDGCGACEENNICKIKDDMQELYQKLLEADGIIFGTPVYFSNVSAQAKAIIDRTYSLRRGRKLRDKVVGAIVTVRRVGGAQTRSLLYSFFIAQRMIVAGGAIGYGRDKGDVRTGVGGGAGVSALEEAREVGMNVASLMKRLSAGKASS